MLVSRGCTRPASKMVNRIRMPDDIFEDILYFIFKAHSRAVPAPGSDFVSPRTYTSHIGAPGTIGVEIGCPALTKRSVIHGADRPVSIRPWPVAVSPAQFQ